MNLGVINLSSTILNWFVKSLPMAKALLPGDVVCSSAGRIWGHGTVVNNEDIISVYFGTPTHIDMLTSVTPLVGLQYIPEVGDVVVGRVVHIANKKWKLNTHSSCDTFLSLSAINLPGTVQRRKSEEDEMNMHDIFNIGDLLVCEVQKVSKNGAALHTRNDLYGKLTSGLLVTASFTKLMPLRSRFISTGNIKLVAGCNGMIWISTNSEEKEDLQRVAKLRTKIMNQVDADCNINLQEIMDNLEHL